MKPRPTVPWQSVFSVILALVYGASPVDLFPEAIFPLLGYLDDIVVIPVLVVLAVLQYRRAKAKQASEPIDVNPVR